MQGDDERLGQVCGEGEHVLAVGAAEDPVLVLEQDDVDVEPPEHPRGAHVVAANGLRDRREQTAPLRARRLVDDRDEIGTLDARRRRCSAARRSAANVPIPQARGGYVETIAVRMR